MGDCCNRIPFSRVRSIRLGLASDGGILLICFLRETVSFWVLLVLSQQSSALAVGLPNGLFEAELPRTNTSFSRRRLGTKLRHSFHG